MLLLSVSCTKIDQKLPQVKQEITFQTASYTKAIVGLETDKKFISYAYYLQDELLWASDKNSAFLYINGATISYSGGVWKDTEHANYWPLTGKLTFFAWTDNTSAPSINGTELSVNPANGYVINGYSTAENPNKDLMLAEIAKDKEGNTHTYYTNGVPAVFKHILSKFEFEAKLGEVDENVGFRIKSIVFEGLDQRANYNEAAAILWDNRSDKGNITMFDNPSGFELTNEAQDLETTNSILIPQSIISPSPDSFQFTITYTKCISGVPQSPDITRSVNLSEIYGKNIFQPGFKYLVTITIGQQEVFWAPGVKDWETSETPWYQ